MLMETIGNKFMLKNFHNQHDDNHCHYFLESMQVTYMSLGKNEISFETKCSTGNDNDIERATTKNNISNACANEKIGGVPMNVDLAVKTLDSQRRIVSNGSLRYRHYNYDDRDDGIKSNL